MPNFYWGFTECDIFSITHTGYIYEFEIKKSRSDFKADFNKSAKHQKYKNEFDSKQKTSIACIPNRFYYLCPDGLIKKEEVPEYAGLAYYTGTDILFIKNAPLIHKNKSPDSTYKMIVEKCYNRYMHKYMKFNEVN